MQFMSENTDFFYILNVRGILYSSSQYINFIAIRDTKNIITFLSVPIKRD